jgi:predicted nucleotidyltransferase
MFEKIIVKIGSSLDAAAIPYMIVGGQAVLLYGEPRLTRDVDITLGIGIDRWKEIVDLAVRAQLKLLSGKPEAFIKETYVLPVVETKSGVRVDFIFSHSRYEKQAIRRANRVKIRNTRINFAAVEDMIIHKIFAGRPRDIEDIRHIVRKNSTFDIRYIKMWLRRFESMAGQKKLVNIFEKIVKDSQS